MASGTRRGGRVRTLIVVGFASLTGLIAGSGDFLRGYLGHLIWYDDGVYMAAATLFSHGVLPYRDFAFLHPPGVVVLLTPFAFAGRFVGTAVANEAARLLVVLVAIANVVLFSRVVNRRSTLALATGLVVFTLHPDVLIANQSIYLEPLLIAACLIGTALVFDGERFSTQRWRWWAAGVAFGAACAIKIWGLCPLLALVVVSVSWGHRRDVVRLIASAASGFVVLCVPFFVIAPTAFIRDVFVVQLVRTDPAGKSLMRRIGDLGYLPSWLASNHAITGGVVVLTITVVVWSLLRTRRQPLSALEWYSFASAGLTTAAFMVPGDYYNHYGAFAAVFFGLVASGTVARLVSLRGAKPRSSYRRHARTVVVAAAVIALCVLLAGYGLQSMGTRNARWMLSPRSAAHIAALPPGECVVSDNASVMLLSNRFRLDDPNCPSLADSFGEELALTDGQIGQFQNRPAVQRAWLSWLQRADAVVLSEATLASAAKEDGWAQDVQQYLSAHFQLVDATGSVLIYRRTSPVTAAASPSGCP